MVSREDQVKGYSALSVAEQGNLNQPQVNDRKRDMLNAVPLMIIPVVLYNIVALLSMVSGNDPTSAVNGINQIWFSIDMPTKATVWNISIGDTILLAGLFCLFFELIKSTQSDQTAIINHSLSLIVFIACLIEFMLLHPFATSVFFLLSMMALMDVVAGFIVTIQSARRDVEFGS
jgi:hypothetical protein